MTRIRAEFNLPWWLKPMNRLFCLAQRLGIAPGGMYFLTVTGRRSGKPRTTPLSLMAFEGQRYLVGGFPGADWVANARAASAGALSRGKSTESVRLVELTKDQARPVLRAFPTEVPTGVPIMKDAGIVESDNPEAFERLAGRCAVFRVESRS